MIRRHPIVIFIVACFLVAAVGTALGASGPRLVRDINPGSADSLPDHFASVGNTLFFRATDPRHGAELWASNGTAAGTRLVKDIYPGSASSNPYGLNNAGGRVFFRATDPVHGTELWVSNGTARGTRLVKDINPGSAGSDPDHYPSHPGTLIRNLGGTPYFAAYDPAHGYELWTSDGTAAGTHLVKDVYPGPTSSNPTDPTLLGRRVFFGATDPTHGAQLWATNGTAAGTRRITDLDPAFGGLYPRELTDMAGKLYFIGASASGSVSELWTSDGTAAGTRRVDPAGREYSAGDLTSAGGLLFFAANDHSRGRELWRSDGTPAGTRIVKDINASPEPTANSSNPEELANVAGTLFFAASDRVHGTELWRSDGTTAGTRIVRDLRPGPDTSRLSAFTAVDSTLFFIAFNFARGYGSGDLWKSDGTAAGTSLVKTWPLDGKGTLRNVLGTLFFTAYEKTHGYELWTYTP